MLIPLTIGYDQIPTSLSGFTVIHAEPCRHCVTIMLDRDDDYIVATWTPLCGEGWTNPNHFWDFDAAAAAFDRIAPSKTLRFYLKEGPIVRLRHAPRWS